MRFIINFFIFGFIFYMIYLFFPEAFHTLVNWAQQVFAFFQDLFLKMKEKWNTPAAPQPEPTVQAILFLLNNLSFGFLGCH